MDGAPWEEGLTQRRNVRNEEVGRQGKVGVGEPYRCGWSRVSIAVKFGRQDSEYLRRISATKTMRIGTRPRWVDWEDSYEEKTSHLQR
jgi:hypothetical protein